MPQNLQHVILIFTYSLKDAGHLSIKDKLCGPYRTMAILFKFLLPKQDNLSIIVKLAGPKMSIISL